MFLYFSLSLLSCSKEEAIHTGKQTPPCPGRKLLSPPSVVATPSERWRWKLLYLRDCNRRSLGEKDAEGPTGNLGLFTFLTYTEEQLSHV